jgi:hypothetical protein
MAPGAVVLKEETIGMILRSFSKVASWRDASPHVRAGFRLGVVEELIAALMACTVIKHLAPLSPGLVAFATVVCVTSPAFRQLVDGTGTVLNAAQLCRNCGLLYDPRTNGNVAAAPSSAFLHPTLLLSMGLCLYDHDTASVLHSDIT